MSDWKETLLSPKFTKLCISMKMKCSGILAIHKALITSKVAAALKINEFMETTKHKNIISFLSIAVTLHHAIQYSGHSVFHCELELISGEVQLLRLLEVPASKLAY